jgi:diguanylate cyclase (GGDEF)-like protein/PAS domain S-box-containing protein
MGVYAANGQCVLANNAYAQLVGATREALLAQNFNNIASWQQSGLLDDCHTALASQTLRQNKIQIITSFGKNICLEYQISPVTLNGEHHLLIQFVDLTEHEQLEEQLRHFAFYDFLTGLPNRRLLLSRIEQASRTSRQRGNYVAILFIDLNKFKQLNDVHGHDIGDQLLIKTGSRLLKAVRKHDTVARLGGDEFVLLLEELDAEFNKASEQAHAIAEKIRTVLSAEYVFGELHYHSSASIGITLFLGEEGNPDQILKEADEAMYTEKNKLGQQQK